MPRARKQADILTAKRKRVRRAINTIRKTITPRMPESERHARMMYVQRLETNLKQTYVGRVQNKQLRVEAYARAMENVDKLVRQAETVSELFDDIMQRNEQALQYAKRMQMHVGDLEDAMDVDGGSPIWLVAVSPDVVR